jgi:threonyl-tRNA synthetase
VGDKEVESGTVAVRTRSGQDLGSLPVDDLIELLKSDISRKSAQE